MDISDQKIIISDYILIKLTEKFKLLTLKWIYHMKSINSTFINMLNFVFNYN
jgi:hypothetical protein